jgi:4-hydroxy 2-oxovalerate aldolase
MLDTSEGIINKLYDGGLSSLSVVSGMAGVFSAFKPHVEKAARRFQVDPRDIFMELGRRKAVAGQEDMIVEIAADLLKDKVRNQNLSF